MIDEEEPFKRKIEARGFVLDFNNRFCRLLDKITERKQSAKDLVLTTEVRSLMELMIEQKRLKERGVSLLTLSQDSIERYADSSECEVIFIVPPDLEHLNLVKAFIHSV